MDTVKILIILFIVATGDLHKYYSIYSYILIGVIIYDISPYFDACTKLVHQYRAFHNRKSDSFQYIWIMISIYKSTC